MYHNRKHVRYYLNLASNGVVSDFNGLCQVFVQLLKSFRLDSLGTPVIVINNEYIFTIF